MDVFEVNYSSSASSPWTANFPNYPESLTEVTSRTARKPLPSDMGMKRRQRILLDYPAHHKMDGAEAPGFSHGEYVNLENMIPVLPSSSQSYEFTRTVGLQIKVLENDPYYYRVNFIVRLLGIKERKRPVFVYEAEGQIVCHEFNLSDYLYLRKKHLLSELLRSKGDLNNFVFDVEKIRWAYSPSARNKKLDPRSVEFKSAAGDAFAGFARTHQPLLDRAKEAIQNHFCRIDNFISDAILKHKEDLASALRLTKHWGIYDKQYTSDILDVLFGKRWSFFHGEDVILDKESGTLLIPNFWVKHIEGIPMNPSADNNPMAFAGYGMRVGVVGFGLDPYPWALIRVNVIENTVESIIREKAAFGESKKQLHKSVKRKEIKSHVTGRLVHIVGLRKDRMCLKKLAEEYLQGGELDDDKVEVVASLALGQLEADAQEGEKRA